MLKRTAITIPEDILDDVDRAAKAAGESRSRFISRVLGGAVRAKRDAEITQRLDELFSDPEVVADERRTTESLATVQHEIEDEGW